MMMSPLSLLLPLLQPDSTHSWPLRPMLFGTRGGVATDLVASPVRSIRIWVLLLLLISPSLGLTAEVSARLNQAQVYEGDPVVLTIEVVGRSLGQEPDLRVLDADFEVAGVSTAQETQFINGRRSDKTSWQVALRPKRLGRLPIPPISLGAESSEPLSLLVEAVPAGGLGAPGDQVWLEVLIGDEPAALSAGGSGQQASASDRATATLMVQQQVPLLVRAYSARPLLDYAIEVPPIEGAVLTRIGRDQGTLTTRAGQQYRVIERRYTLNPERSGRLRIPPIVFEAELKADAARGGASRGLPELPALFNDPMLERMLGDMRLGSPGSMFERGEPARAQSAALELEVAPSAADFSGEHWLPATALEVDDSWSPSDGGVVPQLAVGEPATRSLTLTARGLAGNQIPEIEVPVPSGFRVYKGQTASETRSDGETLIGISRQQLTLIPTQAGEIELPSIQVPWWDTERSAERMAVVPALWLSVAGAGAAADQAALSRTAERSAETRSEAEPEPGLEAGPEPEPETAQAPQSELPAESPSTGSGDGAGLGGPSRSQAGAEAEAAAKSSPWAWLFWALLLVAMAIVLTGVLAVSRRRWWRWRRSPERSPAGPADDQGALSLALRHRQARDAVRRACEQDDPKAAAAALLAWAALVWPQQPPRSLSALAARHQQAQSELLALERHLYAHQAAGAATGWRGEALWQALSRGLKDRDQIASARAAEELAPLYPPHL
jgi:hypothetical protein